MLHRQIRVRRGRSDTAANANANSDAPRNQCHAEGGATRGGVSKREQTQTNADKRKQTQRRKRKQTQANASKRGQTQTNAYTRLCCGFFTPPSAIPLRKFASEFWPTNLKQEAAN